MGCKRRKRRPAAALLRRRRRAREQSMNSAGVAVVSLVLYVLYVAAGVCTVFALISLAGYAVVWRGLAFPVDLRVGLGLLGTGAILAGCGYALYFIGKRFI
jgi:hypothetical protein